MTLYALPPANPAAQAVSRTPLASSPATTSNGTRVVTTSCITKVGEPTEVLQRPQQQVSTVAPAVSQAVSVTPVASRSDLLADQAQWSWQELRDYVVSQIEQVSGPFPRDSRKEYGIFNRFLTTYGQDGIRVAQYAFEVCGGWWKGSPISINRFAKGSDPYFVAPILDRLRDGA